MAYPYNGFVQSGPGLDNQLDQLQKALMGFITTQQQTSKDSRKREILIALGGTVTKREAFKNKEGKWTFTQVNETVKSTEKIAEHRLLPNGLIELVEKEVQVYVPKLLTTSEYVQIPRECDIFELAAEQGTPLSEQLAHALKLHTSSEVLKSAAAIFWGAPVENTPQPFQVANHFPLSLCAVQAPSLSLSFFLAILHRGAVPRQILAKESDAKAIIALTPVLGLCEETGIEFEWVDVDELKGKPAEKLYSKVHRPAGAPTILHLAQRLESAADDAGKEALVADGVQVFGTNAILRYLADRCREGHYAYV